MQVGIQNQLDRVSRHYRLAIKPIWGATKNGDPLHIGSATLMQVDDKKYLVTAAHVIDESAYTTLYVGGESELVVLNRQRFSITKAPAANRFKDKYDFAIAKLSRTNVQKLGNVRFILETEMLPEIAQPIGLYGAVIGYPNTKNKYVKGRDITLPNRQWRYLGRADSMPQEIEGLSPRSHIALSYNKKSRLPDGTISNTFKPTGISGGGLFTVGQLDIQALANGSDAAIRLAGINIIHPASHRHMIAVRIHHVLAALRE